MQKAPGRDEPEEDEGDPEENSRERLEPTNVQALRVRTWPELWGRGANSFVKTRTWPGGFERAERPTKSSVVRRPVTPRARSSR